MNQLPDRNSPMTPAVMVWRSMDPAYQSLDAHERPLLFYRKAVDKWLYCSNPDSYRPAMQETTAPGTNRTDSTWLLTDWAQVPFRAGANDKVRLALYGNPTQSRLRTALFNSIAPQCDFTRGVNQIAYRGQETRGPQAAAIYRRIKACAKDFKAPIEALLESIANDGARDEARVWSDTAAWINGYTRNLQTSKAFVDAVNRAVEDTSSCETLTVAGCGHAAVDSDTTEDHRGLTYCEACAEELREIDGDLYPEDECYYWESDGEYHTDPEPEDEDEDEDEDRSEPYSGRIKSWGADCSDHLRHDTALVQNTHSDFTMGVELEVECESRGDFSEAIDECHYHFNDKGNKYAMFKRDGSLSDRGFEIVTAARRLPEHLKAFGEWEPHETLRAWKPGNCGVHVHIDSRAFSALTLGKFLMFINDAKNAPFITAIAGRHPTTNDNARQYCAALDQEVLDDPLKAVQGGDGSRYRMVNLCNLGYSERERLKATNTSRASKGDYSTIELRIFRASLKKERLLAQIEFTHAAVMYCRVASWHELSGDAFKAWLATGAGLQYKNLSRWYGVRVPKADKRKPVARVQAEEVCA